MNEQNQPQAMALRGVHEGVVAAVLEARQPSNDVKVLDVGAGQGALSKLLYENGYNVTACEMNSTYYVYDKVKCDEVDISKGLPYESNTFDIVVAAELIEHLTDQELFFEECSRVLKKDGQLILSTPNILSLKSRLQFFVSGYYWSFDQININDRSGLQHVTARTPQQYHYISSKYSLDIKSITADKFQKLSRALVIFLPLMHLLAKYMLKEHKLQNTKTLMFARVIIITFCKE